MAKKLQRPETWKQGPEEHDFPAAAEYLSLVMPEAAAAPIVTQLQQADTVHRKAKDLLRASELALLPATNPHVAKDLKRVAKGEQLSPVLLVRGHAKSGLPLIVADGYHRICASYHLDENTDIPCRIADLR